ncbi:DUF3052 domain-containing protein [Rhizobium sp. KVB221]|uniref:DUF3052 domain-containing protein n=1 Tax=Rhizobium setariae TaxID=2801340 RepID=A0A937CLR0_9HYPH|nr:DUF3052 domain-containing protein [Rhizobium setariae]MBL0371946.1 DUF3052 domain-containing protein [Rhizobium setariae]
MTDAGYSGTPLARKIGLRDGQVALLINVPNTIAEIVEFGGYAACERVWPPSDISRFDYIHLFETRRAELESVSHRLIANLKPEGMVWISWPKKASKVPTTITEDMLREILLPTGLVDVKVAAIDEVWSGLKFVVRKELRAGPV